MRPSGRMPNELRTIRFERNFTRYAEGSVLTEMGHTRVLCTASVADTVPPFLQGQGRGWLTAEYGMLPMATHKRTAREASLGRRSGRTLEIQRLIGRSLRAAIDLKVLGERTITIDCDVIQADGGTRTTAINGGWLALYDAIDNLLKQNILLTDPRRNSIAAVSVGIYHGVPILDLDYTEDSNADADVNVIMSGTTDYVEIQGTAENTTFARPAFNELLDLAACGIGQILAYRKSFMAACKSN